MTVSAIELRECPFCGGEAFRHEVDWCEPPEMVVQCGACLISIRDELWNTRAADPTRAQLIAALEEATEAVHFALNMVEGNGFPPNWDRLRAARANGRAALAAATGGKGE